MRRESQTETAVLGALSVEPMTGYALREAIRDVLGHFWSESYGQIYPTLDALEREGYVVRRGSARPGSSTFALTASGRRRLRELLGRPIRPAPARNPLMLRLFFGRQLGPEACRLLVLEARSEAERRLREYRAIRDELEHDQAHDEDRAYWLLTVSAGEHGAQATIRWANEALSVIDEIEAAGASRKGEER